MSKKRPTEASWESDEDLLGDTSSVSAFSSRMQGESLLDDQIDEDALLEIDSEDKNQNYSFDTQGDIVERIDLGISSENCGFDDTANSQELDYEDVAEDPQVEETYEATEDPLLVDEQPNETICTAQPTRPTPITFTQDDEDSDDENTKKDRGRFQTERNTISLSSTHTKSTDIPDSLEITKEMQEEIDSFEKQKGRGKFNRQRLGQKNRGQKQQQQQQFRPHMQRGGARQRGPNFGQRSQMAPGRFPGPRTTNPMRPRGPHNIGGPRGQPQGQFQQGFNQRPGMNNGRPRFPHEMMQHGGQQSGPASQMRQPLLSSPQQNQTVYQEQTQFMQPQQTQSPFIQPQHEPMFQQIQHSQPQPLIQVAQTSGSNIHVNPNFQGPLPPDIRSQQHPHSAPQPLFSQPQPLQTFQESSPAWVQQAPHSAPSHLTYASPPHHHQQPVQSHPQSPHIIPQTQRQGLLGSPPQGLVQNRPPHPGPPHFHPPQPLSQGQPRQPFQQFRPRPQETNVRPISQRLGPRANAPQVSHSAPQQVRQQRPMASQNMRGPANQIRGNISQMRPRGTTPANLRAPGSGQQRFQSPRMPPPAEPVKGWNPKPTHLVTPTKPEEKLDPEKAKKLQELEEQKKRRAERFKTNAPVKINEGSPSNKKIVLRKGEKRPSGDANKEPDDISPIKTIKIEKGLDVVAAQPSGDTPEKMDDDEALRKALEEQKRHRELIRKAKEAKRQASANIRRRTLALKLAKEGKTLADVETSASQTTEVTHNVSSQSHGQQQHVQGLQQGQGYQQDQGHIKAISVQQQNVKHNQFNTNVSMRGINRGTISNRGQNISRGQGVRNQGQPISVLGQSQNKVASGQILRGHGKGRGHGLARGRGRGIQKQTSVSQLQQVQIQENIDYESYDNQLSSEAPANRTVLPASSGFRQVVGMNSMGAASQGAQDRTVFEATSPQRRIVVDSKQSSTVLIKDLPAKVDLGKISKRCSEYGRTKVFNYKAEEKTIVVQFSSPAEAAAFLTKSFRFMLDMNYYTAVSVPDGTL